MIYKGKTFDNIQGIEQREFCEITLKGERSLQQKRVQGLTAASLSYRVSNPEMYFLLRNIALQIQDQLEDYEDE